MIPIVREARLRPAFAHLYPGLLPNVWQPAATVAEHLFARVLLQRAISAESLPVRVMTEEHFEFRGGPSGTRRVGAASRVTDR